MAPVADAARLMFVPQPQAGSGLRIAAQQGWAPGNAPAIAMAVGIPPGSGATLSERDRRLEARYEERRRRNSHGPQEGAADKDYKEREQERQAFEREAAASKRSANVGRQGLAIKEEGIPRQPQTPFAMGASTSVSAYDGGAAGRSLTSVLDQKVAEKSDREAKYEQKRRQYLAAKTGGTLDEPRVSFQETRVQGAPAASEHATANTAAAFLRGEHVVMTTESQSHEQRDISKEPSHHTEDQWVVAVQEPSERRSQAKLQPQGQTHTQSPTLRLPEQNSTTAVARYPNTDHAQQLQEQMTADSVSAQRARENERRPAVTSTTLSQQGESLPHAREAAKGGPGRSASTAIERKAEYAYQLREQMAADEAARQAMETERQKKASPSSSAIPASGREEAYARGGGRSIRVSGPVKDAKAEYARQLREQMAENENAQRAAEGWTEQAPSGNAGPGWIENATEGREARRKRSNTKYAEQLRAQIVAQKETNQFQQGLIPSYVDPSKGNYQQQQRQGPGEDLMEERRRGLEWQRSWGDKHDGQGGNEAERSRRRVEGEQTISSSRRGTYNPLAMERQKRVDRQREYAEALRRDMATPKVDSLGRPVEDITSPTRTRLRLVKSNNCNYNENSVEPHDRGGSAPDGNRFLQPGPRRQAGGDTRGWSQNQEQQLQRQPLEREYLREYPSQSGAWPLSQDQGRRMYAGDDQQHSRRPPVPGTHHAVCDYNSDQRRPVEGRQGARWIGDEGNIARPPLPFQGGLTSDSQGHGWGDGHGQVEQRGNWGMGGPKSGGREFLSAGTRASGRDRNTWQESHNLAEPSRSYAADGGWRKKNVDLYPRVHHDGQPLEHGGLQEYRRLGPVAPPGGAPGVGVGVGIGARVVSTKASTMHNPVEPEELARLQAKKDAYRKDLETQMAEHKKLVDQRKRGAPGSKEAEVFHLQEAMEERNERNKLAPGYEMGPLGVAVMKDKYSTTGRGQRSPPKKVSAAVELLGSLGRPIGLTNADIFGSGETGESSSLLPPPEGAAGGVVDSNGVPSRRGSGLRELLGIETDAKRDREKSRVQAEALKKQVEDNKARRDIERAQLQLDERNEELKLQKEREQLNERYEQEGKLAKTLESEKLLKEAEEARLALAARKEKAAAEAREEEKREDERVERERKELERKYAKERAVEAPLGQASGPSKPMGPAFPVKKSTAVNSPRPMETPREISLAEAHSAPVEQTVATTAVLTTNPPESPVKRHPNRVIPCPHPAPSSDNPAPSDEVSLEKLRTELLKQKQVTEVLRHEVDQQEAERRKLLDIARCAKESEAAVLRATYERRASQHARDKEVGYTGSVTASNELWRVPPPPVIKDVEGEGGTSSPKALQWVDSADAAEKGCIGKHRDGRRLEMEGTAEDRLLLAGLRRLNDCDRTPGEGCGPASPTHGELGGGSTFQERVPGARAWSRGVASNSGDGCDKDFLLYRDTASPGGIRAESRYVFPDGSVRRGFETPGRTALVSDTPMPLVGTSRMASADLSLAMGIEALGGGSGEGGSSDSINETPGRRRRTGRSGTCTNNGGAYRGPGAVSGASWAPGGRPPRAYVPFLNLPASNGMANRNSGKALRRRQDSHGLGRVSGSVNSSSNSDDSPSPFLFTHSVSKGGRNRRRGRPLAGVGGLLVSPGRAMLTGPGRPGTGASSSLRKMFGDTDSEYGNPGRSRRRFDSGGVCGGCGGNCDRSGDCNNPSGDDKLSDGSDSVGSGSTDVEFLRRRAEAKLRSLDRQEAANLVEEEALDLLVASSPARSTTDAAAAAAEPSTRQLRAAGGARVSASTHNNARRTISTASSSSARSLMYSSRKKRPGTNQSEMSMLGDSRWAQLQAN